MPTLKGATGLAQCAELCWQLRGEAGKRQVASVTHALQHNVGLGGACVVGIYKKAFKQPQQSPQPTLITPVSSASAHYKQLKAARFFEEIEKRLQDGEGPAFIKKINATIGFDIKPAATTDRLLFVIDLKNAPGKVTLGDSSKHL